MAKRTRSWFASALAWFGRFISQLGGAFHGGHNADPSASKLYERPRDEYRP
jgi:hypothetical protein